MNHTMRVREETAVEGEIREAVYSGELQIRNDGTPANPLIECDVYSCSRKIRPGNSVFVCLEKRGDEWSPVAYAKVCDIQREYEVLDKSVENAVIQVNIKESDEETETNLVVDDKYPVEVFDVHIPAERVQQDS